MTEVVLERTSGAPDAAPAPPKTTVDTTVRSQRPLVLAVGIPSGIAAIWFGLARMTESPAEQRVAIVVAGVIAIFAGIACIIDLIAGRRVDITLGVAVGWMILVVGAAIVADWLPLAEARDQSMTFSVTPRLRPDLISGHPLGTDSQALDELGGVVYGARISLQVGLTAVLIGMVVGGLIGLVAGYLRGATDTTTSLLADALLAFPPLILLLAVVSALDPSVLNISLVLALLSIPTFIRLARVNTMVYARREFVTAARSLGATHWRIMFRELAPNVVRPLLAYSSIIVAVLIVAEASLSYLGVGIQRPTPTWGNMIFGGQTDLETVPHLVFVPGTAMFLTVLALNRIGDWARVRWDPRPSKL